MKRLIAIATLAICAITTLPASAKSSLWKVSKGDNHLFIGGTIHVLSKSDFPLPSEYADVYKQSKQIVFETNMVRMQDPEVQLKMIQEMSYQDGTMLKDHIKPETYKALEEYTQSVGIPMIMIYKFKPGMAVTMLSMIELQKLGVDSEGVDQFYSDKASKDSKTQGKLETVEEQLSFLSKLGEKNPDAYIMYTLRDLKKLKEMFNSLKEAWKIGDMSKLAEIGIIPLKKDFPETYQNLIVKRNTAWVPQIEGMMKTEEVEMILVGALHLAGDESVLAQLKALDYKIEQY